VVGRAALALSAFVALALPGGAAAEDFVVTRADDPSPAGPCLVGDCSLREALLAASAATTDDVVSLGPLRYEVTEGALEVGDDGVLTIRGTTGAAGPTTIDGNQNDTVLEVDTNTDITIEDVTIVGGSGGNGGAISTLPDVVLTVQSSTLTGNTATNSGGAIQMNSPGTLRIFDSTFSANESENSGGAVQLNSPGSLTIARSAFIGNRTFGGNGGAIQLNTQVDTTISDTLFEGNLAGDDDTDGRGGAMVFNGDQTVAFTNTTFSANRAIDDVGAGTGRGGAIGFNTPTTATFVNSTLVGNIAEGAGSIGGAIQANQPSSVTFSNSIVADNVAATGANCEDPYTSAGNNLESASTCGFNAAGDKIDTAPLLGPLSANGGPTATHALLLGSPALDTGNPATCTAADQRGLPRALGGTCDIGAYELATCQGVAVNVIGTDQPETLVGTDAVDGIIGLGGDDVIRGEGGDDGLCAGDGTALVPDLVGHDQIFGGAGNDSIEGANGQDRLAGEAGNDTIDGSAGRDRISGAAGKDRLKGSNGKDKLKGGAGKDRLNGGAAQDRLKGGGGRDRCSGGPGRDRAGGCERESKIP
jgi:predicted outer membrane repeat protein